MLNSKKSGEDSRVKLNQGAQKAIGKSLHARELASAGDLGQMRVHRCRARDAWAYFDLEDLYAILMAED
jgi:hypothetical protein